jgi:alpha-amylase/alpha-mannosidase (GH57 family)
MSEHYVCIHGHFYQPPRENPWLEEIELQDSAYPFHDWNERAAVECYGPNAFSRILGPDRRIIDIVNNYASMSFNVGPTLLSWLEIKQPEIYEAILQADREGQRVFSGHGPSMAQVYNHIIMPLAHHRDKRTQVIWGIKDFEYRFKRKPEGMWLSETAVDMETLDILTESGIRFTILGPHQARRVRKMGNEGWKDVDEGSFDSKRPYLCRLPSGRSISLFFYDGPISREVAFGPLLDQGENFANRLVGAFGETSEEAQLVHVATDGETYGHHHGFGDMALAYCVYYLKSNALAKITVYGDYLAKYPPAYEVEIHEGSSWSCPHGVERWRANCGCNSGAHPSWTQEWRSPLRGAMDWLRDNLAQLYQTEAANLLRDPWEARDAYIEVILGRTRENVERFLSLQAGRELSGQEKVKILQLLEMQRHAMLMYTSCGWFFDDISGIESEQVMAYAARAIQLAQQASGVSFEETYLKLLERAPSNIPEFKDGATIYEVLVKPSILDLMRVGVHYGVSSLFEDYTESVKLYSFTATRGSFDRTEAGKKRLAVGKAGIGSDFTWETDTIDFAVVYTGDHDIIGGACRDTGEEAFSEMREGMKEAFSAGDLAEVMRLMDKYFGDRRYSLWDLFKDEQRKVVNRVLGHALQEMEGSFRKLYEDYYSVMEVGRKMGIPLVKPFSAVAEFVLNRKIGAFIESEELVQDELERPLSEIKRQSLKMDGPTLGFIADRRIASMTEKLLEAPEDVTSLEKLIQCLKVLDMLSLDLSLWKIQNSYFSVGKRLLDTMRTRYAEGDQVAMRWLDLFHILGDLLRVRVE